MRAVWLTNVDSHVLETDKNIEEAMDYLASINVNVVFPVVYNAGYTLYPSEVMNDHFGTPVVPNPSYQGRDMLERVTIEAHRNGVEVIPWLEYGFATSYSQSGGHIIATYPEWALRDGNGDLVVKNGFDWMSAINPDAQDYIISLATEILDNYDVDGVQGDDRLPAMPPTGGYDSATVAVYRAEHSGDDPPTTSNDYFWKRWRADKLTEFMARLRDSVKARGDYLILSSSPTHYPWGYDEYLQDSKEWASSALVDNIIPQLYRYDYANYQNTLDQSLSNIRAVNPDIFFAGVLAKAGSWVIDWELASDIVALNRANNVAGETFFFYEGLRANENLVGDSLGATHYATPARIPWRGGEVFRPKATIVNETDAGAHTSGAWIETSVRGYRDGVLRCEDETTSTTIEYEFDPPVEAWYDIYYYGVPNVAWTTAATYTLYSEGDSSTVVVDQTDSELRGWRKLGSAYLREGSGRVLKLDNSRIGADEILVADAAMVMINRKKSPDVVVGVGGRDERVAATPSEFTLRQNYPNPFNAVTVVAVSLPKRADLSLSVYNALGEKVADLANGAYDAGERLFRWNADDAASGVYYCRLVVENRVAAVKMLLIK
ncbi:MAG: family 10 glycosylhydrolase [Ignavibacteriales bacterium]|nr:family 10 glycosylhydrolase [Ignavibacteriales bacterium]